MRIVIVGAGPAGLTAARQVVDSISTEEVLLGVQHDSESVTVTKTAIQFAERQWPAGYATTEGVTQRVYEPTIDQSGAPARSPPSGNRCVARMGGFGWRGSMSPPGPGISRVPWRAAKELRPKFMLRASLAVHAPK